MDYFNYSRREASEVYVGGTPMGGTNPIRVQSMTNTPTTDTEACVEQAIRIIEAGGEYVRLTTQGTREAENLKNINIGLRSKGYGTPLIADVHFNPKVAEVAALYAEGVRINPGNYTDAARTFKKLEYTDEEYAKEIQKIRERLVPFLDICKENHTAIRIGVNHGSLSDRIMSRYGDTPAGMVESCMEFLRICVEEQFTDVVISIKASNTVIMVKTVRLLVAQMEKEGMAFPLHLGVTEAGDGEDGRIKSALGIGALLCDGLGDTIRVSLTEAPEAEIPVARKLVDYVAKRNGHVYIPGTEAEGFCYTDPARRATTPVGNIGGGHVPIVISARLPDYIYCGQTLPEERQPGIGYIVDANRWDGSEGTYPAFSHKQLIELHFSQAERKFLFLTYLTLDEEAIACLRRHPETVIIAQSNHVNRLGEFRGLAHQLMALGLKNPLVFFQYYKETSLEDFQLKAATDMGALLIDGFCDGILLYNDGDAISDLKSDDYDLEATIARIKAATSHLKGLKIGIMGCIVNGPGEMADADYGYVGAGRGKISLYKKKECIEKNIPEEQAVEKLLELISRNEE